MYLGYEGLVKICKEISDEGVDELLMEIKVQEELNGKEYWRDVWVLV